MTNGWNFLEKSLDKKINLEIKVIELFILTISAQIIIISLSKYKLIVISVLINIVAVCWLVGLLISDLRKKKSEKGVRDLRTVACTISSIPFGWKEVIPFILYIFSVTVMGVIISLPILLM